MENNLIEIQGEVRLIYANILYLKQAIRLYKDFLDVARLTHKIAKIRFDARAAPEVEVTKTQVEVLELEFGRRRLERQLVAVSENFRYLLGDVRVPVEKIVGNLSGNLPELELYRLQALVQKGHPSLLAAEKDADAADWRVEQEKAERVPDIGLMLAFGHNTAENEDIVEAGITVPLPIFNRNQGRILESEHLAAKARRETEELYNRLSAKLASEHASYMTARDEVFTFRDQIVPASEKAFSQSRERYKAGKTALLDLLNTQQTLMRARLSFLDALRDANVARARLWKIIGSGTDM
jgi:cobalt-zinc-cadmium efflux system outer membrane protein